MQAVDIQKALIELKAAEKALDTTSGAAKKAAISNFRWATRQLQVARDAIRA